MKRSLSLLLIIVTMVSCLRHATETAYAPSPRLVAIDTLMQSRPDSALTLLLDSTIDDPYYQLLLSEALYKNYYDQINRSELLDAMSYFDSINDPFLSARCHYMNGVGYYEMDSVVLACQEYMKALEIMEEHFEEKELVGHKAKFMALTNTHLSDLFSDMYLHNSSIYYGKRSLYYYQRYAAEPWHIAWVLNEIGLQYHVMDQLDSANLYLDKTMMMIRDTNSLTYRDAATARALLFYDMGLNPQAVVEHLHSVLIRAESEYEYYSRCTAIGKIFYFELQYDSAWFYLNKVFENTAKLSLKKQAAEWLMEICKAQNKEDEFSKYAGFLAPFANQEEENSELKSKLTELYKIYTQNHLERQHHKETRQHLKRTVFFVVGILFVMFVFAFLFSLNKKKRNRLEIKLKDEVFAHQMKQKALGGKMKVLNEALRTERFEKNELKKELKAKHNQLNWDSLDLFLGEDICKEVLKKIEGSSIKRIAKKEDYIELGLSDTQITQLMVAVEKHFPGFLAQLTDLYPKINRNETNQCLLCLLNLQNTQIAALLQNDYSTIKKRSVKLTNAFGTDKTLQAFLREMVF
ncbi:MAG: hypothetical protein J6W30_10240 [Bacteroidales bacterium]|nr:hypothetical protein [Bacteroidales bacterium]